VSEPAASIRRGAGPVPDDLHHLSRATGPGYLEEEDRIRRPADLLFALVAIAASLVLVVTAHLFPVTVARWTFDVTRAMRLLPRVIVFACAVVAALGALALLVALGITLARRRRRDGLNALVAGVGAALLAAGLVTAWHAFSGGVAHAMLGATDGTTLVRDAAIVAAITGSDTARYHRWGRYCGLAVGAVLVTGLALNELTLFAVALIALGGWACGLVTRWSLRTTVRRPSVHSLVAGLSRAGIEVRDLERDESSRVLRGTLSDGRPVVLKSAGREMHGAGILKRLWSILRLRSAALGRQPISLRTALETEALASLMASQRDVRAPQVLLLAHFEPDTLVLAQEPLTGPSISPEVGDDQAAQLFAALRRLHDVGVAHRDLSVDRLVCGADGTVGFRSLENAVVGAGELVRRLDVAQMLTAVASVLGAERAVTAMRAGYRPGDEQDIAAILQPLALSSWGWAAMREARGCLKEVRRELIGEGQPDTPETRLERFRLRTVFAVVALVVAAYVLIGQLSKVNLLGTLSHANYGWFALAVLGSAFTYLGSSLNLVAFVPQRVSVLKGTLVEVSGAFLGLVTPPTVGHLAVNGRFLHKQGVDAATTASAVALSQLVNFIVTVALLIVMGLLAGTGVGSLKIVPSPRLLAVLGSIVVLAAVLVTLVPWTKKAFWQRVWPRVKAVWPQLLDVMSQPLRLLQGVAGNLLLTSAYSLALVASLEAVGAHPPIIATAAVFMAGNTVGAAAPTPGGLGAVEAVLIAGLTAIGIPARDAVAGVLLFRIATFWLPIPPGYALFLVLQRRNVL
jgi:uncharacterized membrane protein YbhN (UPF0104 family)/tRNA A-37 threonylcarbamoyl transferase component Bud32